jgi:hypothetical protein
MSKSLQRDGYFVADHLLGVDRTAALRSELEAMLMAGEFEADPSTKESPDGNVEVLSESHFYTKQLEEVSVSGAKSESEGEEWSDEDEEEDEEDLPKEPKKKHVYL